jgi:hypothetical protein
MTTVIAQIDKHPTRPATDSSGYRIFSGDEAGQAHVMAHRMLDQGNPLRGYRLLGDWLEGRQGRGSNWVHLQFHMAVFELAVGEWPAARRRYLDEVLPAAERGEEALTDAPQLAWRLMLAAPEAFDLPWEPLRNTAVLSRAQALDSWTEMHNVLAIAGAGDLECLAYWTGPEIRNGGTEGAHAVRRLAIALGARAQGRHRRAARLLDSLVSRISELGGSRAQNQLFELIAQSCRQESMTGSAQVRHSLAA